MHIEVFALPLAHKWSNKVIDDEDGNNDNDGDDDGGVKMVMMVMMMMIMMTMVMMMMLVAMTAIIMVMSVMMMVIPETPQHTRSLPSSVSILGNNPSMILIRSEGMPKLCPLFLFSHSTRFLRLGQSFWNKYSTRPLLKSNTHAQPIKASKLEKKGVLCVLLLGNKLVLNQNKTDFM